jgi:DNA topoisomerase VI subunit A
LPSKDKRHQEVVKKIKLIMRDVSKDIITGEAMPILDVPKVGYDNTVWSDQKRMLTIGDKKVQVSPDSTKKIPTFTQYIVMASAIRRLLDEEMESTIRGMYYATLSTVGDEKNKQKFWNSQENSDDAIKAVELLTGVPREEFSVTSKPKGMISGIMVKTLNEEWKRPVVIFADADPWGLGIALRYKIGSESLSYDSHRLVTPNARVLGMLFSDIYEYNIPEVARLNASDEDINRANDMKNKPWLHDKRWQKELNLFLQRKEKCELDAFFKHGFKYLAETYLPQKLRQAGLI